MDEINVSEDNELEEEIHVLQEIYISELDVLRDSKNRIECVTLQVHPATGDREDQKWVCLTLELRPPLDYPQSCPTIKIRNPRGLAEQHVVQLHKELQHLAENRLGECMLFELIEYTKESLTEGNKPYGECAICQDGFLDDDSFTKTHCYHYFHSDCMLSYVEYSERENENDYKLQLEATPHIKASLKPVVCPVCRDLITYDLHTLQLSPQRRDLLPTEIELGPEVRQLQEKMSKMFKIQQAKGGIIDLEEEKNKFLLSVMMSSARSSNFEECDSRVFDPVNTSREISDEFAMNNSETFLDIDVKDGDNLTKQKCGVLSSAETEQKCSLLQSDSKLENLSSITSAESSLSSGAHQKIAFKSKSSEHKTTDHTQYQKSKYREKHKRGQRYQSHGSENYQRDATRSDFERKPPNEQGSGRSFIRHDSNSNSYGSRQRWRDDRNHHRENPRKTQSSKSKNYSRGQTDGQHIGNTLTDDNEENNTENIRDESQTKENGLSRQNVARNGRQQRLKDGEQSHCESLTRNDSLEPPKDVSKDNTDGTKSAASKEECEERDHFGQREYPQREPSDNMGGQDLTREVTTYESERPKLSHQDHRNSRSDRRNHRQRHHMNGYEREGMYHQSQNAKGTTPGHNSHEGNGAEHPPECGISKEKQSSANHVGSHKGSGRKPRNSRTYGKEGSRQQAKYSQDIQDIGEEQSRPSIGTHHNEENHKEQLSSQSHQKKWRQRKPRQDQKQYNQTRSSARCDREEIWELDDIPQPSVGANN